jgi:hypothetical protein
MSDVDRHGEVMRAYRLAPKSKQKAMLEELCGDMPHWFVRDFAVMDTTGRAWAGAPCIIFHLPSGLWHGFSYSPAEAVSVLKNHPEGDEELVIVLHKV